MSGAILGLDIGGANLKAATMDGTARIRRFALWKDPTRLCDEIRDLTEGMSFDQIAVTMTAELCRCFETKRQGVRFIRDAIASFAGARPVHLWGVDGAFHATENNSDELNFAASNWLALATYAGRFAPQGRAVLVDIGSTTTDIVPILDGKPQPFARTDMARLEAGELIYTGVRRTPLCAILGFRAMAEVFATTLDVYLTLDRIPEDISDADTADGRPATREFAHNRLARMLGSDGEQTPASVTRQLALDVHACQVERIARAIQTNGSGATTCIISGVGEFLAQDACDGKNVISLNEKLGPEISRAACAYAVAALATERGALS